MEDGRDGEVLASDRAIDDHTKPAQRREGVYGPPIAPGAIMVENEHRLYPLTETEDSALILLSRARRKLSLAPGWAAGTPVVP